MADRSGAALFADIFQLMVEELPSGEHRDSLARKFWAKSRHFDFSDYQMECDAALVALGLARRGVDPKHPEDGETTLYGPSETATPSRPLAPCVFCARNAPPPDDRTPLVNGDTAPIHKNCMAAVEREHVRIMRVDSAMHMRELAKRAKLPTVASVLDEVGCAISNLILEANATGADEEVKVASKCLRAVGVIRERVLPGLPFGAPMPPGGSESPP